MRELTRSMIRFSWTLPLLGLNQTLDLVTPGSDRRPLERAADTLDALSEAAVGRLSPRWRDLYDRGERWQRRSEDGLWGTVDRVSDSYRSAADRCCGDRH